MMDRLEDHIRRNRSAFDQLAPPDIWNNISLGLQASAPPLRPKNLKAMIKYGFGASAIIVTLLLSVYDWQPDKAIPGETAPTRKNVNTERTVFDTTPSVLHPLAAFILPAASEPEGTVPPLENVATVEVPELENGRQEIPEINDSTERPERAATYAQAPPQPIKTLVDDDTLSPGFTSLDTTFKGIRKLELNSQVCNIIVTSHKGDHVKLKAEIKEGGGDMLMFGARTYKRREYKIKFKKEDDRLKVWIEDRKLKKRVRCSPNTNVESYMRLEVPEDMLMTILNTSGNVSVTGPVSSPASIKTNFGDITTVNITADLDLKSTSGQITATRVKGKLTSESSFGNQKYNEINGDISLRSSSGNISVSQLEGNADVSSSFGHQKFSGVKGNIRSSASSGNIKITDQRGNANIKTTFGTQHYEDVLGDIVAGASSGNIQINTHKGQLLLGTSFGSIRGTNITLLRNSEFRTSSGNITMCLLNDLADLNFDLVASSGKVLIEKSEIKMKSENELQYGSGGISIKGVSTFGNQSYH